MGKPLNCDETKEIRVILNKLAQIYDEALETKDCGNENELCKMILSDIPMIEKSYKNFVERSVHD